MSTAKKIFLSGRITGDPHYKTKFDRAARELKAEGHIVLNPATLPIGLEYADYARICTAMIEAADTVMLLPGYQKSPGVALEVKYAKYIGKEVEIYGDPHVAKCDRPYYDEDDCSW